MTQLTFGKVPHPPFVDRLIPDVQTAAWDDLGPRRPVGVCQHSMVGSLWGTDRWFRRGRVSTGLTDYGIGGASDGARWDGVILRWNDPRGRSATVHMKDGDYVAAGTAGAAALPVSANRAGWANGGSDGLEGDGPAFVRTFGVAAINRDLVSIERSDGGDVNAPLSDKQFASICALTAHWFDQAKVPWDCFPVHPVHGVVTHLLHREFSTKACPFSPVTSRIGEIQERVRQILKAAQAGEAASTPVPTPTTPAPSPAGWPAGYDADTLAARFGALIRHEADGRETGFGFDPRGVISNGWVARGAAEQRAAGGLPAARDWWPLPTGDGQIADLVAFDDNWLLFRPDPAVAWRWLR